jgi:hypothetical protein
MSETMRIRIHVPHTDRKCQGRVLFSSPSSSTKLVRPAGPYPPSRGVEETLAGSHSFRRVLKSGYRGELELPVFFD